LQRALTAGLVVLAVAAFVAYNLLVDPKEISEARQMLEAGQNAKVIKILEPYLTKHKDDPQTTYLMTVASLNEFAVRGTSLSGGAGFAPAETFKDLFAQALARQANLRRSASNDLARAFGKVPFEARDAAFRLQFIQRVRKDLALGNPKDLARELWDRTIKPSMKNKDQALNEQLAKELIAWDGSLTGEMAGAYLALAQQSKEADAPRARNALDRALELDGSLAKSEEIALLRAELAPADGKKSAAVSEFLRNYPASQHRAELILGTIRDVRAVMGQRGYRGSIQSGALLSGVKGLLRDYSATPGADEEVLALARSLADPATGESGRAGRNQALDLCDAILQYVPNTKLKTEIETAQTQWREEKPPGWMTGRQERPVPVPATQQLTVICEGLPSGSHGGIRVDPPDKNGKSEGTSPLLLVHTNGATVEISVPDVPGARFVGWYQDGLLRCLSKNLSLTLITDQKKTLRAKYFTQEPEPRPRQEVEVSSPWSGTWQTDRFGEIRFRQQGPGLAGAYDSSRGSGRIYPSSTVTNILLTATWVEGGAAKGDLEFTLCADKTQFTGRWRLSGSSTWLEVNGSRSGPGR
jgi:hypothetical protein